MTQMNFTKAKLEICFLVILSYGHVTNKRKEETIAKINKIKNNLNDSEQSLFSLSLSTNCRQRYFSFYP